MLRDIPHLKPPEGPLPVSLFAGLQKLFLTNPKAGHASMLLTAVEERSACSSLLSFTQDTPENSSFHPCCLENPTRNFSDEQHPLDFVLQNPHACSLLRQCLLPTTKQETQHPLLGPMLSGMPDMHNHMKSRKTFRFAPPPTPLLRLPPQLPLRSARLPRHCQ
jgi:hypothetical protein